jgi:hypothetical protein
LPLIAASCNHRAHKGSIGLSSNLRLAEVAHRIVEQQSLLEPKPKSAARSK